MLPGVFFFLLVLSIVWKILNFNSKEFQMFRKFIVLCGVVLLSACAATPDYTNYIKAQTEANRQAQESQKPLVRLVAQPGMAITGLQSVEVYAPTQAPVIQQAKANEWAAVAQTGLGIIGTLGGIKLGGEAMVDMASQVRQAGTVGYSHINQAGPTYTYTNSYNTDSTHTPTVVNQPAPVVVTQPAPVIVDPVVVNPVVVDPVIVQNPAPVTP